MNIKVEETIKRTLPVVEAAKLIKVVKDNGLEDAMYDLLVRNTNRN